MRLLVTTALLMFFTRAAVAADKEAEDLFRGLEQKLRSAKTLRVRFDLSVTVGKPGSLKGMLLLGEGDKFRLELEGKPFGELVKLTVVSDGARMSSCDPNDPKNGKVEKAPKEVGANLRAVLPRLGVMLCWNSLDRGAKLAPEFTKVSDFKFAGKEVMGGREMVTIEYTVTERQNVVMPPKSRVKLWLDAKTRLPVKLSLTSDGGDITATTDVYSEFVIDPKMDAKQFEVPK
jgi:outer membrane lipoprotein-sorting protein